ncbi:heavy-metal-associated domain-containing protein [Segatella maculosa]|uniref:heavy-metal-associated domain-containing protein n=1 Tax=Segatella maculosa TaxID=439703 RepID=UPI000365F672|nr:heavy-metal-associated domain-containing protein [Segatella maculosa]
MKKVILTMLAVAAMSATMQAKTVKTEIPVNGKCNEMCKPRIEKAAKAVPGVLSATWNLKAQKLTLVYDNTKTDAKKVQKAVSASGHDSGNIKAPQATYNKLPGCCKYRK